MRLRSVQFCFLLMLTTLCVPLDTDLVYGQSSSATQGNANDVRAACAQDVQKLCANVPAGGGRIIACLKQHQDQVSDGCKQAVAKAMQQSNGGAGTTSATPAPPASAQPETRPDPSPAPPATVTPKNSQTSSSTKSNSPGHYFLMKKVQLIDQGLGEEDQRTT